MYYNHVNNMQCNLYLKQTKNAIAHESQLVATSTYRDKEVWWFHNSTVHDKVSARSIYSVEDEELYYRNASV